MTGNKGRKTFTVTTCCLFGILGIWTKVSMRCTEEVKPVFNQVWCYQNTWQSFPVLGEEILSLWLGLQNKNVTSYRVEIGEEAEWRGAVDPERQEVLQLGMSLRLEGSTRQRQGAQEWVDLALGEGTYSRDDHIWVNTSHCYNCFL